MISIEQQQQLLLAVSRRLKQKITIYAIGGTAMMFLGFKEATLDIDLVFENEKDRKLFSEAVLSLGYEKMDSVLIYGAKNNHPQMFSLGEVRFDLFLEEVVSFIFSSGMMLRAEQIRQYGDNLIVRVADLHDLILMKCATDRLKDRDDARRIIAATEINWNIIINEAKEQILLGKEKAAFELGCFLEELKNNLKVKVPQKILNELFAIVKEQAARKQK